MGEMARRFRRRFPVLSDASGFVTPSTLGAARANFQVVHEMIGGNDRMADWADRNPGDFYKLYARTIVKEVEANVTMTETLEQKLARLEAGDRAINVTPTSIDGVPQARQLAPAQFTDLDPEDDDDDR